MERTEAARTENPGACLFRDLAEQRAMCLRREKSVGAPVGVENDLVLRLSLARQERTMRDPFSLHTSSGQLENLAESVNTHPERAVALLLRICIRQDTLQLPLLDGNIYFPDGTALGLSTAAHPSLQSFPARLHHFGRVERLRRVVVQAAFGGGRGGLVASDGCEESERDGPRFLRSCSAGHEKEVSRSPTRSQGL